MTFNQYLVLLQNQYHISEHDALEIMGVKKLQKLTREVSYGQERIKRCGNCVS